MSGRGGRHSGHGVGHTGREVGDDPGGGFALMLVVLLLFGIGVAGAAGYQVVFSETLLSVHAKETQTALSVARAGLRSYIGKQVGVHDTIVTYSIEGGDAVVSARLVAEIDDYQTLYLLESEGVYTDPTFTGSPARRTVYQYAIKREVALDHLAALIQASGDVDVEGAARLWGDDQAPPPACEQTSQNIGGVLMGSGALVVSGSPLNGSADSLRYGSYAAVLDSARIDWPLLTNTDFPVDYEGTFPSCALPVDSFPVTRFTGPAFVGSGTCGRGVLIVTGSLWIFNGFSWDGVILAGRLRPILGPGYNINGLVVTGLNGAGNAHDYAVGQYISYDRCIAFKAGKRLSHFQPMGSTWWEEM